MNKYSFEEFEDKLRLLVSRVVFLCMGFVIATFTVCITVLAIKRIVGWIS